MPGCGVMPLVPLVLVTSLCRRAAATAAAAGAAMQLSLPRRSHGRLAAMCGGEGRRQREMVASWVRAVHSGFAASALPKQHRQQQQPVPGVGSWPPDLVTGSDADAMALRQALQRPGAYDADLDPEPPRRYTLKLDEAELLRIAGPGRRLITSWTTGGPKRYSIARNLALSIRKNCGPALERIFVFVALDADARDRAQADGFQVVLNEESMDLKDDIWKMRWLIQITFLSLGLEVLVVDSDIVFFRNPFEHFGFDADQEVSTDHFFPEKQLWASWLRPAEHINTGFIFSRPSPTLVSHLVEFVDRHYHERLDAVLERDGMDQRVYNRYTIEKMEANPPAVFAVYKDQVYDRIDWQADPPRTTRYAHRRTWRPRGNGWGRDVSRRMVKIRILDPAEIAHGMNFFWRKAHRLRPGGPDGPDGTYRPPAVAHVNGVDPKQYFLRDRNVWYIDEWNERFGDRPSFLTYEHPTGLSLKDDFEYLMAALEVAAYFRRRVVLPDTMNCANSPAFKVWQMDETLANESGCTYDYFAHANGLYEVYSRTKPYAVEAGLGRTAQFRQLKATSYADLPDLDELRSSGQLRAEILGLQGAPAGQAAFDAARVLHIPAGADVRAMQRGLRQGDFGLRMNAERVFNCAYQQVLSSAMACLDETFIEEFGTEALDQCESVPRGCGPVGICCCWPFWGYGDKLQYFTGVPWDLPCNCGLELCEGYDRPAGGATEHCCRHAGNRELYPYIDPGVFPCREPGHWTGVTGAEDAHTYSSAFLSEFLRGKRTAEQTFQTCRLDRSMRRGDYYTEASLRWCSLQVSAFLLREGAIDAAKEWWTWMLSKRRAVGNASLMIVAMDGNGTQTDNTHFDIRKLRHDTEQLQHLAAGGTASGSAARPWRQDLRTAWLSQEVLPRFETLLRSFEAFVSGRGSRVEVMDLFDEVRPFFNRAVYVPNVALPRGAAAVNGRGRAADFLEAERALREQGVAVIDDVLTFETLDAARELLVDSTVWFAPKLGGAVLKAHLRDGLHAELGLSIAREMQERWMPGVLGKQPLFDIFAHKFDASAPSQGLPLRCEDGVVIMLIWVVQGGGRSQESRQGLRFYAEAPRVPEEYSFEETHGMNEEASPALQELVRGSTPLHVAYRVNRAVLWRADMVYDAEWSPASWGPPAYASRRVDWLFSFGRSQARGASRKRPSRFVPTLEGRADGANHYYATDHDHR